MRAADRSGARIALVAGDRDIEGGTVGLRTSPPVSKSTFPSIPLSPKFFRNSADRLANLTDFLGPAEPSGRRGPLEGT